MFANPSPDEIRALLKSVRTIAVVGLSPKPYRPSHNVARAMQRFGYRILPVRPAVDRVLGERAYARLADLPEKPDLVDVFRNPREIEAIVDDCIRLGLPRLWLQEGAGNEPAAERARAAGIQVVMERCVLRDYVHLIANEE